jgi:Trm5-related predicted tRNA methylase
MPDIQAASHRQSMANRADRQGGRVHHPQRRIGERGDALGVPARPQHLVQQLMHLLMGECLARTHGRLRESKETSA